MSANVNQRHWDFVKGGTKPGYGSSPPKGFDDNALQQSREEIESRAGGPGYHADSAVVDHAGMRVNKDDFSVGGSMMAFPERPQKRSRVVVSGDGLKLHHIITDFHTPDGKTSNIIPSDSLSTLAQFVTRSTNSQSFPELSGRDIKDALVSGVTSVLDHGDVETFTKHLMTVGGVHGGLSPLGTIRVHIARDGKQPKMIMLTHEPDPVQLVDSSGQVVGHAPADKFSVAIHPIRDETGKLTGVSVSKGYDEGEFGDGRGARPTLPPSSSILLPVEGQQGGPLQEGITYDRDSLYRLARNQRRMQGRGTASIPQPHVGEGAKLPFSGPMQREIHSLLLAKLPKSSALAKRYQSLLQADAAFKAKAMEEADSTSPQDRAVSASEQEIYKRRETYEILKEAAQNSLEGKKGYSPDLVHVLNAVEHFGDVPSGAAAPGDLDSHIKRYKGALENLGEGHPKAAEVAERLEAAEARKAFLEQSSVLGTVSPPPFGTPDRKAYDRTIGDFNTKMSNSYFDKMGHFAEDPVARELSIAHSEAVGDIDAAKRESIRKVLHNLATKPGSGAIGKAIVRAAGAAPLSSLPAPGEFPDVDSMISAYAGILHHGYSEARGGSDSDHFEGVSSKAKWEGLLKKVVDHPDVASRMAHVSNVADTRRDEMVDTVIGKHLTMALSTPERKTRFVSAVAGGLEDQASAWEKGGSLPEHLAGMFKSPKEMRAVSSALKKSLSGGRDAGTIVRKVANVLAASDPVKGSAKRRAESILAEMVTKHGGGLLNHPEALSAGAQERSDALTGSEYNFSNPANSGVHWPEEIYQNQQAKYEGPTVEGRVPPPKSVDFSVEHDLGFDPKDYEFHDVLSPVLGVVNSFAKGNGLEVNLDGLLSVMKPPKPEELDENGKRKKTSEPSPLEWIKSEEDPDGSQDLMPAMNVIKAAQTLRKMGLISHPVHRMYDALSGIDPDNLPALKNFVSEAYSRGLEEHKDIQASDLSSHKVADTMHSIIEKGEEAGERPAEIYQKVKDLFDGGGADQAGLIHDAEIGDPDPSDPDSVMGALRKVYASADHDEIRLHNSANGLRNLVGFAKQLRDSVLSTMTPEERAGEADTSSPGFAAVALHGVMNKFAVQLERLLRRRGDRNVVNQDLHPHIFDHIEALGHNSAEWRSPANVLKDPNLFGIPDDWFDNNVKKHALNALLNHETLNNMPAESAVGGMDLSAISSPEVRRSVEKFLGTNRSQGYAPSINSLVRHAMSETGTSSVGEAADVASQVYNAFTGGLKRQHEAMLPKEAAIEWYNHAHEAYGDVPAGPGMTVGDHLEQGMTMAEKAGEDTSDPSVAMSVMDRVLKSLPTGVQNQIHRRLAVAPGPYIAESGGYIPLAFRDASGNIKVDANSVQQLGFKGADGTEQVVYGAGKTIAHAIRTLFSSALKSLNDEINPRVSTGEESLTRQAWAGSRMADTVRDALVSTNPQRIDKMRQNVFVPREDPGTVDASNYLKDLSSTNHASPAGLSTAADELSRSTLGLDHVARGLKTLADDASVYSSSLANERSIKERLTGSPDGSEPGLYSQADTLKSTIESKIKALDPSFSFPAGSNAEVAALPMVYGIRDPQAIAEISDYLRTSQEIGQLEENRRQIRQSMVPLREKFGLTVDSEGVPGAVTRAMNRHVKDHANRALSLLGVGEFDMDEDQRREHSAARTLGEISIARRKGQHFGERMRLLHKIYAAGGKLENLDSDDQLAAHEHFPDMMQRLKATDSNMETYESALARAGQVNTALESKGGLRDQHRQALNRANEALGKHLPGVDVGKLTDDQIEAIARKYAPHDRYLPETLKGYLGVKGQLDSALEEQAAAGSLISLSRKHFGTTPQTEAFPQVRQSMADAVKDGHLVDQYSREIQNAPTEFGLKYSLSPFLPGHPGDLAPLVTSSGNLGDDPLAQLIDRHLGDSQSLLDGETKKTMLAVADRGVRRYLQTWRNNMDLWTSEASQSQRPEMYQAGMQVKGLLDRFESEYNTSKVAHDLLSNYEMAKGAPVPELAQHFPMGAPAPENWGPAALALVEMIRGGQHPSFPQGETGPSLSSLHRAIEAIVTPHLSTTPMAEVLGA